MLAMLHLLGTFLANLFKSRRRLEVENLFLRHQLNVALRRSSHRCLWLRYWQVTWLWPLFGLDRASFILTQSCGGIEQGFGPIGAGNLAVGQGGPELAVSCANSSNG